MDVARPRPPGAQAEPRVRGDRRATEAAKLRRAMFWLKKLVSFWLMPLPLCLALLFAGLLLGRRPRTQGVGRRLCCAAALLLLLLSNRAVSNRMVRPLESEYGAIPEVAPGLPAPPQIAGCAYIVVLGAGNSDMPGVPATGLLTTSALERIVEAVRLLRVLPGARLLVSGNTMAGGPSHATVLARAAEALGIAPSRITMIEPARDTEDESRAVARIAGGARVGLVTSAWHMP